ncbi:copper homeostasis protein CutC [Streptococcus sp. sy004]|uniref:copper homeostasis protein CutC n=1 Tax=Streptococcus sp. sy004 TaxID=2600149 RepID=UPI0011B829BA|nr:copper homeostasis protein CutC [Streptococcus sp. sy004]TWT12375.1 copper homeostasis protein CutC [Streptococcus sp. sy004]
MLIKELCTETVENLLELSPHQVARVELCQHLAIGGVTPFAQTIEYAAKILHSKGIALATMIRPRGGDFVYTQEEIELMRTDILKAIKLGSDALVMGLLTLDNQLDCLAIESLLPSTQRLPLVFHMAFDLIPKADQLQALERLIDYSFTRVLMHGSANLRQPITDNINYLKSLVDYANNRIEIMIGGGVTAQNCHRLASQIGTPIVHGTKII